MPSLTIIIIIVVITIYCKRIKKSIIYNTCHFILIPTAFKVKEKSELPSINIKSSATGTLCLCVEASPEQRCKRRREGKGSVQRKRKSSINSRYNQGNHIMQAFQLLLRLIFAPRYSGPLRAFVIPAPGFLLFLPVGLIDADNAASWLLCLQLTVAQSVTILLLLQQPRFRP